MKTSTTIKFKASTNMPVDLKDVEVITKTRQLLTTDISGFPRLLEKLDAELVNYEVTIDVARTIENMRTITIKPGMLTVSVIITPHGIISGYYSFEEIEEELNSVVDYCKSNLRNVE